MLVLLLGVALALRGETPLEALLIEAKHHKTRRHRRRIWRHIKSAAKKVGDGVKSGAKKITTSVKNGAQKAWDWTAEQWNDIDWEAHKETAKQAFENLWNNSGREWVGNFCHNKILGDDEAFDKLKDEIEQDAASGHIHSHSHSHKRKHKHHKRSRHHRRREELVEDPFPELELEEELTEEQENWLIMMWNDYGKEWAADYCLKKISEWTMGDYVSAEGEAPDDMLFDPDQPTTYESAELNDDDLGLDDDLGDDADDDANDDFDIQDLLANGGF